MAIRDDLGSRGGSGSLRCGLFALRMRSGVCATYAGSPNLEKEDDFNEGEDGDCEEESRLQNGVSPLMAASEGMAKRPVPFALQRCYMIATAKVFFRAFGRGGGQKLPLASQALKGWCVRAPATSRKS
eukprot:6145066-Amphidinium_carterae.1